VLLDPPQPDREAADVEAGASPERHGGAYRVADGSSLLWRAAVAAPDHPQELLREPRRLGRRPTEDDGSARTDHVVSIERVDERVEPARVRDRVVIEEHNDIT
jgi:hypothetical protein